MMSFFTAFWTLLGYAGKLVVWAGEMIGKLAMGSFHIGVKVVSALLDLVLTPFSWASDHLLDLTVWSRCDLAGILLWGLSLLLAACTMIALTAFASNLYRRLRH